MILEKRNINSLFIEVCDFPWCLHLSAEQGLDVWVCVEYKFIQLNEVLLYKQADMCLLHMWICTVCICACCIIILAAADK